MKSDEELERVCQNCNYFFPESIDKISECGICLNDEEFEPFIDELLENYNYVCCQSLVDKKKFSGNREACLDFSEIEIDECIEIDEDSEFRSELLSLIKAGNSNKEALEDLLIKEQLRSMDLKTLPVDKYSERLKSPKPGERNAAISGLRGLIASGNEEAIKLLIEYLKQLPAPEAIEEVHFNIYILESLEYSDSRSLLIPILIDKLYNTPSNNTTRQWISAIFRFLEHSPYEKIANPLSKMLKGKIFSYRLKKKIKDIINKKDYL